MHSADATRSCSISRPLPIAEALQRRAALTDTDAYRLLNGAADGTPGLAVDRYADVAVVHADSQAVLDKWLSRVRDLSPTGYVKVRPPVRSRIADEARERLAPTSPAWGPPRERVIVRENGLSFEVRPASGLSVGLFLDMREVRTWLRTHTSATTVLNLFAYTCSLGVAASAGGARRVVNLDLSRPYLEWGKSNYALNGLAADDHNFIYGDAFDWLGRFARRRQYCDVVIVDPPSFSSTPFSVTRDYARLVGLAARVVAPGGILLAATNHVATTASRFELWLAEGLSFAEREGRLLERWSEPAADFPVPPGGRPYLKVAALKLD